MVRGTGFILLVAVAVPVWTPATTAGQLPNCTINFDDTCPDVTPECGATFVGGDGCDVIGELMCYSSGFYSYQVAEGGALTITLSDDLNSLSVFFVHEVAGGAGTMTFLSAAGQQVDDPLFTDGPCASGPMLPTHVLFFSRPVRTIEVDNTGDDNIWIDTFEVNPPCNDAGDCDDSDPCTSDMCDAGNCTHTPMDCDDSDPCNGVETCDSVAGCQDGTPVDCSAAGDQCNTASCDPGGAPDNCDILTPVPDGTECNDGDSCNANDQCTGGVCAGMGGCDDDNACTTDECVNDECVFTVVDCSDAGDQCNTASCDPDATDGNCDTLTPLPDGTVCDDGDASTNDTCVDGTCVFTPSTADCPADLDGNGDVGAFDLANLLGNWGPNVGHPADLTGDGSVGAEDLAILLGSWGLCPSSDSSECQNDADCDDGVFCNGAEVCDTENGLCLEGSEPCSGLVCDENSASCVECVVDADCDDGLFCTGSEVCEQSECEAGAEPCGSDEDCNEVDDSCSPADQDNQNDNGGDEDEDTTPPDDDSDGVPNEADQCPETAAGVSVDSAGCSESQTNGDDDGGMTDNGEMDSNGCGAGSCGAAGGMSFAWILAALSAARVARRRGWPAGKR